MKKHHDNLAKSYENPIEKRQKDKISFTLHPPDGEFTQEEIRKIPAYVTERIMSIGYHNDKRLNEQYLERCIDLGDVKRGFEKDEERKPIYAIEAFLMAHEAGLYPPMWTLNYIAKIFLEWHNSQGSKSLDDLMGVKPGGKGKDPLFKGVYIEGRDKSLCLTVFVLKTLFGFTVEEASYMAARRLEETSNWDKSKFGLRTISEETIKDIYKRKYSKIYNQKDFKEDFKKRFSKWSKQKKKIFLDSFPEDAFPIRGGTALTPDTILRSGVK